MSDLHRTERTQFRRGPDDGASDREAAHAILDEALIAHLAFPRDGVPAVQPRAFHRDGDHIYFHGSYGNTALRAALDAPEVCCTVTLLDGIVLARTLFHHSVNYRSVVLWGPLKKIEEEAAKRRALVGLIEHFARGRNAECPDMTAEDVRKTMVVSMPIEEASVKVRRGPSSYDPERDDLSVWAGVVPLRFVAGDPVPDPHVPDGMPIPPSARTFARDEGPKG